MRRCEDERTRFFLFSPFCLAMIALTAVNDHWLKAMAVGSDWSIVTGKLSDFGAAIFLPAWLEVAFVLCLRLPRRQSAQVAALATLVALTAIETVPSAVAAYVALHDQLFALLGLPLKSHLTPDLTDLIALPLIYLSYSHMRARQPKTPDPTAQTVLS